MYWSEDEEGKEDKETPKAEEAEEEVYKPELHAQEIEKVQLKKKVPVKKKGKTLRKRKAPKVKYRDIGVDVPPPDRECQDPYCPFHGKLPVRGQIIEGVVVSTKMQNTVVVQRERLRYIPKYERYEKRTSRYFAHWPPCIDLEVGDMVKIMECRPLSKHKSFVVIGRL
ncbi:MAG: 30S ribosomal protein S17 [Thermoplasmata archaeon]|nr:30S ribosomal protein S17 [Thermoplasmata archaeon]